MASVKVYQIGVGDFGRFGFEKLVEMHNHLNEPQVELKGVVEQDFEKLEAAEKFARANGIEIEKFSSVEEMYGEAEQQEGIVMVYDAGPSEAHAKHVYESMNRGLFHLAEKPPSMTREQHIRERKLSSEEKVFWKVDFIERESPVVKKAVEILEDTRIDSIEVFRESSTGIQKILEPAKRTGVQGGDILDKMVHEIYVLDFLEKAGNDMELELKAADSRFLVPHKRASEKMMDIYGGYTEEINEETATGMTRAEFSSGDTEVVLNSSWLGMSREARRTLEHIREQTGHEVFRVGVRQVDENAFESEEARFFITRGERNLLGDMLQDRLFDLDSGEEIETPDLIHDQLYRVIEKAVKEAAGDRVREEDGKLDVFMNGLFDARESALEKKEDFIEELDRANERVVEKSYVGSITETEKAVSREIST